MQTHVSMGFLAAANQALRARKEEFENIRVVLYGSE